MKHKVFAYGNLMHGMPMFEPSTVVLGKGTTTGTMYYCHFPRVLLSEAGVVHGELHEVDEHELTMMDYIENIKAHAANPTWYKRKTCTVTLEDGSVHENVWVYAVDKAHPKWPIVPNGDFRKAVEDSINEAH